MTKKITVVVADDHPLVRKGIVAMLSEEGGFDVVGEATDGESAQMLCKRLKPDVLLLDLNMPGAAPLETMTVVQNRSPDTRIIVLTAFSDLNSVRGVIAAGAMGYLLKEEGLKVVMQAIRTVMQGGRQFSQTALMKLVNNDPSDSDGDLALIQRTLMLNEREITLLRHMAEGKEDDEIGKVMGLSERTIRHYLKTIYEKLGVRSRVEAVVHIVKLGLLDKRE